MSASGRSSYELAGMGSCGNSGVSLGRDCGSSQQVGRELKKLALSRYFPNSLLCKAAFLPFLKQYMENMLSGSCLGLSTV